VTVDVLAVGAHPDDVEIGIGGLLHKLARQGLRIGILDLTRGEMGTRGTVEERLVESTEAARVLGVVRRENAGLPDAGIHNTPEQQRVVIPFLRSFRPKVLFITMAPDRHPDHEAAHYLVRDANFFAGLARVEGGLPPHRTPRVYHYHPYFEAALPHLVVDISDSFETKREALRAHASQFFNPDYDGPPTYISSKSFWDSVQTRAAYWGSRIGVAYGEALYGTHPLGVDIPPGLEGLV